MEAADCVQKCGSCGPGVLQVPAVQKMTGIMQTRTAMPPAAASGNHNGHYRVRMATGLLYRRVHDANVLGSTTSFDQDIRPTQALALWTRNEEQIRYSNFSE